MASVLAFEKRWGQKAVELPINDKAWEIEAYYITQVGISAILMLSPKRIILGGGVMKQGHLFPLIRKQVSLPDLNSYISTTI